MKHLLSILLIGFWTCPIMAQFQCDTLPDELKPRLEIHLATGPSLPVGKYGNERLDEGGFAKSGFGAELGVHWFLSKNRRFGINGLLAYQIHDIDENDISDAFVQNYLASSVDLTAGNYTSTLLMAGPFIRLIPCDVTNLAWDFRGGFGLVSGSIDNFAVSVTSELGDLAASSPEDSQIMTSFFLASDFIYYVGKENDWGIRFGVLYAQAQPDYSLGLPDEVAPEAPTVITFLNVNVGIAYKLF